MAEDLPDLGIANSGQMVMLLGHCHQKAFDLVKPIQKPLEELAGFKVEPIDSFCCGMAGDFGFSAETYDMSMKMVNASLLPAIGQALREALIAADGASCRCQIKNGTGRETVHVAFVLDRLMNQ